MLEKFIGRTKELEKLSQLIIKPSAKLIVIKGRRRVGKSRLLMEFGKHFKNYHAFSGLPPEKGISAEEQREEFAKQLNREFGTRGIRTDDWGDLFWHLAQQTQSKNALIVLDEITWMAQDDPTFLPKLKNAWDLYFKKNTGLTLALCGSISGWIEKNILNSTGFLGRSSLNMTLNELPLNECLQFWNNENNNISNQDKLIMLSVTGGIPRYLEEINHKKTALQNISQLCFDQDGILFSEFDHIFSDLFSRRSQLYKRIVNTLSSGCREAKDIASALNLSQSGDIYEYLDDLNTADFIARDFTWNFKDGKVSKLSHYRLKDNYCRFYLKYVQPMREKITKENITLDQWSTLAGFSTIIGLQFENLVLKNRALIINSLGLNPGDIVCDNPYFQRKTSKQRGCQIDYLIQTRYNTLFICEIKFTTKIIRTQVIDEVKEKIKRLKKPRNFSCVPILIYFGDIQETVEDNGYFAKLINFEEYMK